MAVQPVSGSAVTPTNPASPGRTHMYYTGKAEYVFGDGLSYDAWDVTLDGDDEDVLALDTVEGSHLNFSVTVANRGRHGGGLTVLAFWRPVGHSAPLRQKLFAFAGVAGVGAGSEADTALAFTLKTEHLAIADENGDQVVRGGVYEVFFKAGSEAAHPLLVRKVAVRGEARLVQAFEG